MNQSLVLVALLATLSCCQSAPAQDRYVEAVRSTPGFSQLVLTDGGDDLVLMAGPDGSIEAVQGGRVVPVERIRREGDHLRILDEAGATLYDVRVLPGGGLAYPYDAALTLWSMDQPGWLSMAEWTGGTRKVIGVTTLPVDGALAAQLGLEADAAFVINDVTAGLPAEKAGLKPYDVVVAIDGEEPATVERLREAIKAVEADGTLTLSILRKGEPRELEVGVTEENSDWLTGGTRASIENALAYAHLAQGESDAVVEALREHAEARSKDLAVARDRLASLEQDLAAERAALEAARADSARGVADAANRAESARKHVEELELEIDAQRDKLATEREAVRLLDFSGGAGRALVLPQGYGVGGFTSAGVDERLKTMEERLARLEELLEKLIESDGGK